MNKKTLNLIILPLVILFAVYLTGTVSAQLNLDRSPLRSILNGNNIGNLFGPSVNLELPGTDSLPDRNMFVTAGARNFDPNEAVFTWYLDGREVKSGLGETKFSFRSAKVIGEQEIKVRARYKGKILEDKKVFRIADIAMDFSTNTFVPVGYEGKVLPTKNSAIRVAAIPLFPAGINTDNLIYRWSLDFEVQTGASGINRSEFVFESSKIRGDSHIVTIAISAIDRSITVQKSMEIPIVEPEIVMYESGKQSRMMGKKKIKDFFDVFIGSETTFAAMPFFFNITRPEDLEYEWSLNGEELFSDTAKDPHILNLKIGNDTPPDQSVSLGVSVTSKNPRNFFERDFESIMINIR